VLSRLIWSTEFRAPISPVSKRPIIPDINDEEATFTTGFVSAVKMFRVVFQPRSPQKAALIQKSFEEAQREWEILDLEKDVRI
jgi:hypothetical protein